MSPEANSIIEERAFGFRHICDEASQRFGGVGERSTKREKVNDEEQPDELRSIEMICLARCVDYA